MFNLINFDGMNCRCCATIMLDNKKLRQLYNSTCFLFFKNNYKFVKERHPKFNINLDE